MMKQPAIYVCQGWLWAVALDHGLLILYKLLCNSWSKVQKSHLKSSGNFSWVIWLSKMLKKLEILEKKWMNPDSDGTGLCEKVRFFNSWEKVKEWINVRLININFLITQNDNEDKEVWHMGLKLLHWVELR